MRIYHKIAITAAVLFVSEFIVKTVLNQWVAIEIFPIMLGLVDASALVLIDTPLLYLLLFRNDSLNHCGEPTETALSKIALIILLTQFLLMWSLSILTVDMHIVPQAWVNTLDVTIFTLVGTFFIWLFCIRPINQSLPTNRAAMQVRYRRDLILTSVGITVPVTILVLLIINIFYHSRFDATWNSILQDETQQIEHVKSTLQDEILKMVLEVRQWSQHAALMDHLDGDQEALKLFERDLITLAENKKSYAQIRFLDHTGHERVRINHDPHATTLVPSHDLQNKAGRYYFTDVIGLPPNSIYISPLDLNVERGKVETPHKPVIRIGIPVFDRQGARRGIFLLNVLSHIMLEKLIHAAQNMVGSSFLINREGYYLHSAIPGECWGFMLPEKAGHKAPTDFPRFWNTIKEKDSGQLGYPGPEGDGVITFSSIDLTEISQTYTQLLANTKIVGPSWKLFSYIPRHRTPSTITHTRSITQTLLIVLSPMVLFVIWILARGHAARRRHRWEMGIQEQRYHTLFDNMNNGVAVFAPDRRDTDIDFIVRDYNQAAEQINEKKKSDLLNRPISHVCPEYYENGLVEILRKVQATGEPEYFPFAVHEEDKILRWVDYYVYKLPTEEVVVAVHDDVTQRKRLEEHMRKLAFTCPLTGLANRKMFKDLANKAISHAVRTGKPSALMFLDLDKFKPVNDTHGHEIGDRLLIDVAKRLKSILRMEDSVARLGGNEFTIILPDLSHGREDVEQVARKVLHTIREPFHYENGVTCAIGVSIGIVLCPEHGRELEGLLQLADEAMYAVKKAGRNRFHFYEESEPS